MQVDTLITDLAEELSQPPAQPSAPGAAAQPGGVHAPSDVIGMCRPLLERFERSAHCFQARSSAVYVTKSHRMQSGGLMQWLWTFCRAERDLIRLEGSVSAKVDAAQADVAARHRAFEVT